MRLPFKHGLTIVALSGYIGFMVFGFIHLIHMADMGMPMKDCPFVQMEQMLCPSSVVGHIEALKTTSFFVMPYSNIVFPLIVFLYVFATYKPPSLSKRRMYAKNHTRKEFSLFQHLFSSGVLHTKVY